VQISSPAPITSLLLAWGRGETNAFDRLTPLVYAELRRLARCRMRGEGPDHTLQTTALVHEAYLRLIDTTRVAWHDRTHFVKTWLRRQRAGRRRTS
jgi:hypothetical protein